MNHPVQSHLYGDYNLFDCPSYSSTARHTDLAVMCYESYETLHILRHYPAIFLDR